ncbi:MAG: ABC transporter permease [Acidobacteriota bacterium]|nr:ABC transporter permease [Acidobacteriota bacterium]
MKTLLQDIRYALRVLWKSPSFSLIAIVTLALGIGANTAIFSLVNAVLVRPLKYKEPDRLVMVWEDESALGFPRDTPAPGNYADWKSQNQSFEEMAATDERDYDLTGEGEPEKLPALGVTANFFPLLGVNPALGRNFNAEEDKPGANHVAVISHSLWQTRFGANQSIIGRKVLLNGEPFTIVGVMPQGFQFQTPDTKLWVPIALTSEDLANHNRHYLKVVARLKPNVSVAEANADVKGITQRFAASDPNQPEGLSAAVVPLHEQLTGESRRPLLLLLVAVGFVLLIACANIAGVLLSRAAARQREMAVRAALGASRWRIIRQLLTESILLGGAGGVLGLLLAMWSLAFLQQLIPPGIRESTTLTLDLTVLSFTLLISMLAGVIFGLAPALSASKTDLNEALKQGTGRTGYGAGQRRLRNAFVIAEMALALVLLVGAGLLIQTLSKLRDQYSNMRPESVLTLRTVLSDERYPEHAQRTAFYDRVLERVKNLPGVVAAGYTTSVPLIWKGGSNNISLEGRQPEPGVKWNANHRQVSPGYFQAIGMTLKQGRLFTEQDNDRAMPVVIINETMARQYWPGENPVGKRFKMGGPNSDAPWMTIVGVVADVKQMSADAPARPEMYMPVSQVPYYSLFAPRDLVIRANTPPTGLVPAVRQAIHEVDPNEPVSDIRTMEEVLEQETSQQRVGMILLAVFAGLALLLASLGIYGVLSYFVVQHVPEIGVRMALGAQAGDVLKLIIGKGMRLVLAGVAIGLAGSFALTRLMKSLLFGVSAFDPLTFAAVAALLVLVALLACYLPARRATRVDPMVALRYE